MRGDCKNPNVNIRRILRQPNIYMTMQDFIIKMVIQREKYNNAFAYIDKNSNGDIEGIYPIPYTSIELVETEDEKEVYAKFTFKNGRYMAVPYVELIHLRKHFDENDFFGESNLKTLFPIMQVMTATDQGIVNHIKNSATIRWILKFSQVLKKEDIQMQVSEFKKNYLNINNEGGVMASDPRYSTEQVKSDAYVPNALIIEKTTRRIHSYFGISENIILNKYTEDEWNAFYEGEIEPIAKQLSDFFTNKIFTSKEQDFLNEIIFTSDNLQYASMKTKLGLVSMVDRSAMTPNEWRKALNRPPIFGGDNLILRKDTGLATDEQLPTNEDGEGVEEDGADIPKGE